MYRLITPRLRATHVPWTYNNLPFRGYSLHFHSAEKIPCLYPKGFVRRHWSQYLRQHGLGLRIYLPYDAEGSGACQARGELKVHADGEVTIVIQHVTHPDFIAFSCEKKTMLRELYHILLIGTE